MDKMQVVLLSLVVLVAGVVQAGDRGVQPEVDVLEVEEGVTTIESRATPHSGLTDAEKAKLENPPEVNAKESEKVRMPSLHQAEPKVIEATGKRAKPAAHPGEVSSVPERIGPYPGMTEAELEKMNREPVPTSNSDGIDNFDQPLIPTGRNPEDPQQ
jgi:hypothetical protein